MNLKIAPVTLLHLKRKYPHLTMDLIYKLFYNSKLNIITYNYQPPIIQLIVPLSLALMTKVKTIIELIPDENGIIYTYHTRG